MKNLKTKWLLNYSITVFSCVLIIVFGIAFLTYADPVTTTIGENIATNDLSVTGNVTSGTWQGTVIGSQYGGTGQDFSGSTGILKITAGTASIITDSSTNWDTAYTYSQVGHLPLAGGTLTGGLTVDGVTGLVDSDIPDTITASNYLPLTGGTLSADLILQETGDAKLTIHSNTDSPTADSKLLVVQKGTTPVELFSVDEDGDVAVANDLSVTGNITSGIWQGTAVATEYGGTGADWSAVAQGNLPYFSAEGALSNLAPGTDGQFLKSQGTGADPEWANVTRSATFVVAASDSSTLSKQQADYVCDGTDDQVEIQAAIQAAIDAAYIAGGGKILLMEGDYIIVSTITGKDYVDIEGMGFGTMWDVSSIGSNDVLQMGNYSSLSNLKISGSISPFPPSLNQNTKAGNNCKISNVWIDSVGGGIECENKTNVSVFNVRLTNIRDVSDYGTAIHITGGSTDAIYIKDFYIEGCNRGVEIEDGSKNVFVLYGYLKDVQNYNATGNQAFSIDAHSHDSGGGVENITFSDIYMENTDGFTAIHTGTGWATADLPKNIFFNKIIVVSPQSPCIIGGNSITIQNSKIYSWNPISTVYELNIYPHSNHIVFDNVEFPDFKGKGAITSSVSAVINDVHIQNCVFTPDTVSPGLYAIYLYGMTDTIIKNNEFLGTPGTQALSVVSTYGQIFGNIIANKNIWIRGGSSYVDVFENIIKNGTITNEGSNHRIYKNQGYTTESSGTATLVNGQTSIAVTHGLDVTPSAGDITITPIEAWGTMTEFYIDTYTSTQFTIYANDPGQDVDFAWKAIAL